MYEHGLIRIQVSTILLRSNRRDLTSRTAQIGQGEMEGTNYLILVKFATIRKLGLGFAEFGQPRGCLWYLRLVWLRVYLLIVVIFDLHMPPNFERESRAPEIIDRNERYKPRSRIFALDDAHARVAPYAYHLRVLLADPDDLTKFELICYVTQCKPRPVRISRVDAHLMRFFSQRDLYYVQR
jgi:RNA-dependent RNA polymerase